MSVADLSSEANYTFSMLQTAIKANDVETVKRLLKRGLKLDAIATPDNHLSPLWLAVLLKHRTIADLLLTAGADVNEPFNDARQTEFGYDGATALLHLAVKNRDNYLVHKLLFSGAKVNACNAEGESALQLAIAAGCEKWIVQLLLDFGASTVHTGKDGSTVLHYAARAGNVEWMTFLLEQEATAGNVIYERNRAGHSPLFLAVARGHTACAEALLSHGANAKERLPEAKTTLLHVACETGNAAVIRLLLRHGADPQARDGSGRTPWMLIENLEAAAVMVRYFTLLFRADPFLQNERVWEWIMLSVPLRKLYLYYLFRDDEV